MMPTGPLTRIRIDPSTNATTPPPPPLLPPRPWKDMTPSGGNPLIPTKQGVELSCRLLSKEKEAPSAAAPSFRVYYGVAPTAVPFLWESQPGTPKHHAAAAASDSSLPPLTPPPSYLQSSSSSGLLRSSSAPKHGGLLSAILPRRLVLRKRWSPSTSRSMSSSSLSSSASSPLRSLYPCKKNQEDVDGGSSPKSTLCFRWAPSPAKRL